jgi:uroporphyrin-III C-methyltransferase/precorrin-2 dehydrogenase/sirohydrochlorin ferrochelatase
MSGERKRPLAKLEAPYRREVKLEEVEFESGMRMLRVVVREGHRITQLDLDAATARSWGETMLSWAGAAELSAPEANDGEPAALGEVYLVGAGPGGPDLLTFRAHKLMGQTDVVLYDRLVDPAIVDMVRPDAERIYVGKRPDNHTLAQEDITALLIRLAREGKRVLRLKGGDPFIFGRGGEEIEGLAESGIPFQIVPGVTAAAACSAYAGIPLTHRDHSQACIFVTGHGKNGEVDLDWSALVRPQQTVAIYMGLKHLGELMRKFVAAGADADFPAAIIENGARTGQRIVVGTIGTLERLAAEADLHGPTIIIVGTVVTLRGKLGWDTQPVLDTAGE